MKKLILIASLFINVLIANAMDIKKVPDNTLAAFHKKFPTSENVKWSRKGDDYKAEFNIGEEVCVALFDKDGKWLSTKKEEVLLSNIPFNVVKAFGSSKYKNWKIKDIKSVEVGYYTTYKFKVTKGIRQESIIVDENAQII